jgi:hypothetical protein
MNYAIITDPDKFDSLEFIPTIILGFYQSGKEKKFFKSYEILRNYFPDSDIIGCSSESNIYDTLPHVDIDETYICIYMCIEMRKESYIFQLLSSERKKYICLEKEKNYGAIILHTHYNNEFEQTVTILQKEIGQNRILGAIAGNTTPEQKGASIFYNGTYISEGTLVWFIDQAYYTLEGISVHDFDPIGFDLEITRADGYTILEIENRPALDMVEEMIGKLDPESIEAFNHPFFITSDKSSPCCELPLTSMRDIDREAKSIILYKKVSQGDTLRLAISCNRREQEEQLNMFRHYTVDNGIAFLFVCIAYKRHWAEMEAIYLMHLAKNLKVPFIGFHTLGEIGPLTPDSISLIQNQTLTLAVLSER